jgi:hypothetical protein
MKLVCLTAVNLLVRPQFQRRKFTETLHTKTERQERFNRRPSKLTQSYCFGKKSSSLSKTAYHHLWTYLNYLRRIILVGLKISLKYREAHLFPQMISPFLSDITDLLFNTVNNFISKLQYFGLLLCGNKCADVSFNGANEQQLPV